MILVTGGFGYIGSFTIKLLNKKNSISVDNLSRGNKFVKNYAQNFKLNINNTSKITNLVKKYNIDTILHLAAYTCVRESKKFPKLYKKNNLLDQKKFLKHVINLGVKKIIFASSYSGEGYSSKNKKKFSPYATYKILIEEYLKKMSLKNNIRIIVLRYPNVTGASKDGKLGEKNNRISRIFPTFYQNIKNNKKIILYYDIKKKVFPTRNYVHVEDIANLNIKVIKFIQKTKKKFLLIKVNNKIQYTNKQIFNFMKTRLKKGSFIIKSLQKIEKLSNLNTEDKKLKKLLGWKIFNSSIKNIIDTNLKWFDKIYKRDL